jgi:hypothetical protein
MGIALCHFELSANELGLKGKWEYRQPEIPIEIWEYTATWIED